jgi:hypothetical protein
MGWVKNFFNIKEIMFNMAVILKKLEKYETLVIDLVEFNKFD